VYLHNMAFEVCLSISREQWFMVVHDQ
jgi:hypothetical protein